MVEAIDRLVNYLFKSGNKGKVADRLVLTSKEGADLGGWCRGAVKDAIIKFLGDTAVDHPAHYGGDTSYECIKVLEAWMTAEQASGFNIGNAIKYLSRAGKKGDAVEDMKKARWYINREIQRLEKQK